MTTRSINPTFNPSGTQAPGATAAVEPLPVKGEVLKVGHKGGEADTTLAGIFEYLDYREYLQAWWLHKKKLQPSFSGALFAKKAGLQSHSLFGMVMRGERNLSTESVRAFTKGLSLIGREALYFEKLVFFNQSKKSDDRAHYFSQLQSIVGDSGNAVVSLVGGYAEYLSKWYIVVIREMVSLKDFNESPDWIAKKLRGMITAKQAEAALQVLLSLGMIERTEHGLKAKDSKLEVLPNKMDFAVRNFHKQNLKVTEHMVDAVALQDRNLMSLTLSLSQDQRKVLNEKILGFLQNVLSEFGGEKSNQDQVVSLNMQTLALTIVDDTAVNKVEEKR